MQWWEPWTRGQGEGQGTPRRDGVLMGRWAEERNPKFAASTGGVMDGCVLQGGRPVPVADPRSRGCPTPVPTAPLMELPLPCQPLTPSPSPCPSSQPGPSWAVEVVAPGTKMGQVGGMKTKPVQQSQAGLWPGSSLRPPRCWAGSGAPPPGPVPADRPRSCLLSARWGWGWGVNFLLKTMKLLRAEGGSAGQHLTLGAPGSAGRLPLAP